MRDWFVMFFVFIYLLLINVTTADDAARCTVSKIPVAHGNCWLCHVPEAKLNSKYSALRLACVQTTAAQQTT